MESSSRDTSYYRVRFKNCVKYITVEQGTLHGDELLMPLYSLPPLQYGDDSWTIAIISRDPGSGKLKSTLTDRKLAGVHEVWHAEMVDCLLLQRVQLLSATAFECFHKQQPGLTMIAKVARFEWEIPRIERETQAYRLLEGTGLAPRFLGHVHEQGRVIGLLLEKIDGRMAGIDDLARCNEVLGRFHNTGLVHGDINRNNFIVSDDGIRIIDFEHSIPSQDEKLMKMEIASLAGKLAAENTLGGNFETDDDDEDET
ncbi:hypothetical protein B7463_g6279, partial [Scytalidium lignicola]